VVATGVTACAPPNVLTAAIAFFAPAVMLARSVLIQAPTSTISDHSLRPVAPILTTAPMMPAITSVPTPPPPSAPALRTSAVATPSGNCSG
jgi:hypothetical protein